MAQIPEESRYGGIHRRLRWFTPNMELPACSPAPMAWCSGWDSASAWPAITSAAPIIGRFGGILCTRGPRTGTAKLPLARLALAFGKDDRAAGTVQWLSSIAWDAGRDVRRAGAQLLFHVPFWVGARFVLGIEAVSEFTV